MKKMLVLLLSFVILFYTYGTNAFCESLPDSDNYYIKTLYDYLKNDAVGSEIKHTDVQLKNHDTDEAIYIDSYHYVEEINDVVKETVVFALPSMLFSTSDGGMSPRLSGFHDEYDSSYSVYGQVTYYYSTFQSHGNTGYLLTSVAGGWTVLDSSVTLSDRSVYYACEGFVLTNQGISSIDFSQYCTKYPGTNSFSYNTGFTNYIINDGNAGTMGATSEVTLRHGGSSVWTLEVVAKAFGP